MRTGNGRTVGVVAGVVAEEVQEHAAGGRALGLGHGASGAGPLVGGVEALVVDLTETTAQWVGDYGT